MRTALGMLRFFSTKRHLEASRNKQTTPALDGGRHGKRWRSRFALMNNKQTALPTCMERHASRTPSETVRGAKVYRCAPRAEQTTPITFVTVIPGISYKNERISIFLFPLSYQTLKLSPKPADLGGKQG